MRVCVRKGVLVTYSSSRCRCDSTMVSGAVWAGLGGISRLKVNLMQLLRSPRSGDELCWSKQHGATTSCVLQWRAQVLFQTRDSDWEGNSGICPPTGWLQGREKWRACRPVTSQVYTASGEERVRKRERERKVNIRYAWQITWGLGGDESVYRPEERCISACSRLYADKMDEESVNNEKGNVSEKQHSCIFHQGENPTPIAKLWQY